MKRSSVAPRAQVAWRVRWTSRSIGASLVSLAWLTACGQEGESTPRLEPVESVAYVAEPLTLTDPATALAVPLPQVADPLTEGLVIPVDAPLKGTWSGTQSWPLNGLHSVLLPNGRVLTFGTPTGDAATQDGRYFDVWDPTQRFVTASHQTSFQANRVNSFCSAAAFLTDGRLLVSGGNSPLDSNEFSPVDNSVATSPFRMADERWYGSMLTLASGDLLMLGGSTPYGALRAHVNPDAAAASGAISMTPELYNTATGWRSLFGAQSREAFGPDYHRYWYPRAWVAPDGRVFGISSEKMWYLDPTGAGSVTVAGNFKTAADNNTRPNIGPTSSAVMFAPGRILQVGGNGYYDGHAIRGSALATIVDITSGAPVVTDTAPMSFARHWPSTTVLPNGQVVVTGGTQFGNNGGSDAVYAAELWDPTTQTWTAGASAAQIRVYHSAAILMPNGAVLSTGGGAPGPVNNLNAELYFPPYFFRAAAGGGAEIAPRPQLTALSQLKLGYGAQLDADVTSSSAVAKVVLIGASTVTHSFNMGQRRLELPFEQVGGRLAIGMPASPNEAPPGYYLLSVLDGNGVPSTGVLLTLSADTPPPASLLPRDTVVSLSPVSLPDHSVATDATGLGVVTPFAQQTTTTTLLRAQFLVRAGLADPNCVSLESLAVPGQFLRHYGYRLMLGTSDGSALFNSDATFCEEAGLAGTGITLHSKNFPERVLRRRGAEVWIDLITTDPAFAEDASFEPDVPSPVVNPVVAPAASGTGSVTYTASAFGSPPLEYQWSFGDGSANSGFATTPTISHTFSAPGVYAATLTVRGGDGSETTTQFLQAIAGPVIAGTPVGSSNLAVERRTGQSARLWVVNIDNDTVSVFDTLSNAKLAEISVGSMPRSIAVAPNGALWVANKGSATLSVIDPVSLSVSRSVALPRASQPFGVVVAPNGNVLVALEAIGTLQKLDATGNVLGSLNVGSQPRHLALTQAGAQLLVARFVTPPQPGEATATVQTTVSGVPVGGEVLLVDPSSLALIRSVTLQHSSQADTEASARGVPNYLGAPAISPDGISAWIPSKQDNIQRGWLRDGQSLDFQDTVRAITSRINLSTRVEDYAARIDHDDSGVASAALYHPAGNYLFVALEASREVAVVDAYGKRELFRVDAGRAPQGLAVSADGRTLYVHNALDRTAGAYALAPLLDRGEATLPLVTTLNAVAVEKLSGQVLRGKQFFYDARDTRLARDGYLSCATCHNDGGSDGRTWDLTHQGEGLRNTTYLRGRGGAQGRLHWSANFDEVQDFEAQIRSLSQGTGLMSDAAFNTGTRNQPLGTPKAGVSADLDALAAYVASLSSFAPSPYRSTSGALSTAAASGRSVFITQCVSCHGGTAFSDSDTLALRNVGTIKPSSGSRLGGALLGIDTPTLRDVWLTAPYLHDGSALSLSAAIQAHTGLSLGATDLANVAAFTQQIGGEEPVVLPSDGIGLLGQYFANVNLTGAPALTRTEAVNFDWGTASPGSGIPVDAFSARWTGQLSAPTSGSYVFQTSSDDGVRLYVNGALVINNWTDHAPTTNTSAAVTLVAGQRYDVVLEYYDKSAGAVIRLNWQAPGAPGFSAIPATQLYPAVAPPSQGLVGQYFANVNLSGTAALTRTEGVNFDWGTASPGSGIPVDAFSVRWSGQFNAPSSGSYVFQTTSDDGVRLYVNGALVINNWTDHGTTTNNSAALTLVAGRRYDLVLEYYDRSAGAVIRLNWQPPGAAGFVAIPAAQLFPTAQGLLGQYFSNATLSGSPVLTRSEPVSFDWGTGAPATGLPVDNFSVRWTGRVSVVTDGNYTFQTTSDDGVRLWVNGSQVINNWTAHAPTTNSSSPIALKAGSAYDIKLEYYEAASGASIRLDWVTPGTTTAVPMRQQILTR